MPVYEFFCKKCNTLFNFFSKTINPAKQPLCPKCSGNLKKQVSTFACIDSSRKESGSEKIPFDEKKLEKIMGRLEAETANINEEDPRQAADLMKKFSDMAGIKLGKGMEEAISRIKAEETPEKIEQEMGDILENEDPFQLAEKDFSKTGSPLPSPKIDEKLYDL